MYPVQYRVLKLKSVSLFDVKKGGRDGVFVFSTVR